VSLNLRQVRNWRGIDIDAFAADLELSTLVVAPPDDIAAAFYCYNTTLLSLLNKHAPLKLKRVNTRPSARWSEDDCRATKRKTRTLEEGIVDNVLQSWRLGTISFSLNVAFRIEIDVVLAING